jgi:hypothetical protein
MIETERLATRDEYDDMVARMPLEARGQWWPVPWRIATGRERAVKVALWGVEAIGMLIGLAIMGFVLGGAVETYEQTDEIRDTCLKHATTGIEIEGCHHGRYRPTPDL